MKYVKSLLFCLPFFLYASCREKHTPAGRSFYYWRTVFDVTPDFQSELCQNGISRLYIRFFDVCLSPDGKKAFPQAEIQFKTKVDNRLEIVPVVFIRNEVFKELADSGLTLLSEAIYSRVWGIDSLVAGPKLHELQLDCDWTESTREAYFGLVSRIRERLKGVHAQISATIRLHQVKYFRRTGVPPVDRGMLMFYNMGKIEEEKTLNSVYDGQTASAYLVNFSSYPLKLDVGLPAFRQALVFRNGKLIDLLAVKGNIAPLAEPGFRKSGPTTYEVLQRQEFMGTWVLPGEVIRYEGVGMDGCLQAARQIAPYLTSVPEHIAIFHLDPQNPELHEKNKLESIYDSFN